MHQQQSTGGRVTPVQPSEELAASIYDPHSIRASSHVSNGYYSTGIVQGREEMEVGFSMIALAPFLVYSSNREVT